MKKPKKSSKNYINFTHYLFTTILLFLFLFFGFILGRKYETIVSHFQDSTESKNTNTTLGSWPGWVKYTHSDNKYSLQYPENWYYDGGTLYSISQIEYESSNDKGFQFEDVLITKIEYSQENLSEYIETKYYNDRLKFTLDSEIYSNFGDVNIVTYRFCNSVEAFMKGATLPPGSYCEEESFINLEENGFLKVNPRAASTSGELTNEAEIFRSVLSTIEKI